MLLISAVAVPAQAEIPPALRPTNNPWFAAFAIGPAIKIDDMPSGFKMLQEIGYHLTGGFEGPALGFSIAEAFGDDIFTLQVGPKFWFDIQPVAGLGLYLAPMVQVGYALLSVDRFRGDDTFSFFNFQFGFEARLIVGGRGLLFYRPITFDMFAGDFFAARYDMMFGGGITF